MNLKCVDVARAALGDPARSNGSELLYHCHGQGHVDGDQHPSLSINPKKDRWICGPCGKSGGPWALAAFLAGCSPDDKPRVKAWLFKLGLLSFNINSVLEKIYPYNDECGKLLFEILRYKTKDGKTFKARRPEGKAGWIYSLKEDAKRHLKPVRIVPYRLPDVLAAQEIHVHEGEQCCDNFSKAFGLVSTTAPFGAGKWPQDFAQYFRGRPIYVYPDNDKSGQEHANDLARNVYSEAASVKIITLPGLPAKGDVSDWIDAGHTKEELLRLIAETPAWMPPSQTYGGTGEEGGCEEANAVQGFCEDSGTSGTRKPSVATRLAALADDVDLFHTRDGIGYANLVVGQHVETWPVRSRPFQLYLTQKFYKAERRAPSAQALRDAAGTIDAKANFDGAEQEVFVRVAELDGAVYLDLADEQWRAVRVTKSGWSIDVAPPVRFRRTRGMLALPEPVRGGAIDELDEFVNVSDKDRPLIRAWTSAAMMPRGPYPILNMHGEQGSAKSTTQKVLRELVDPNMAPLRTLPHNERDLQIAANNSHLLGLDNVSYLPSWLSDALCRLATGGGLATRELFTDQDEVIFDAQRPILLNGIEDLVLRGDYLQRSIVTYSLEIPDAARRDEKNFWAAFEAARPRILGAFLDAMAVGLRNLGSVQLANKPRMADFAIWAVAAAPALGLETRAFLQVYSSNGRDANVLAIESSLIAPYVCALIEDRKEWKGTASELLDEINLLAGERLAKERGWPKTPRALSGALRRLAPNLRAIGINVAFLERESDRRPILLTKTSTAPSQPSPSRPIDDAGTKPEPSSVPSRPTSSDEAAGDGGDGHDGPTATVEVDL